MRFKLSLRKPLIASTLITLVAQLAIGFLPYLNAHLMIDAAEAASCAPLADSYYRWQPTPGGVSLDQAATFLANMSDVTGAYYDQVHDRIVFVGKENTGLPQFNKDDLAVAIRSLTFNNTIPSVSIDWGAGGPSDPNMTVDYFGNIQNTNFGNVLFNADYKMKQYMTGWDPNGNRIVSNVPGYKSVTDYLLAQNPNYSPTGSSAWVIRPQLISLKKDTASNSFVFDQVKMELHWWGTTQGNTAAWDTASAQFAQQQTDYYDQFAAETPAYAQAKELGKIVGVVKWLKDNGIATDFNWAKNYTPSYVATPATAARINGGIVTDQAGIAMQVVGGVDYSPANTYNSDDGTASSLKTASEAVGAPTEQVKWNFTQSGQQYDSVAVSADAFRSLGSFTAQGSDLQTSIAGGNKLALNRTYSSLSGAQNEVGIGWDMLPAKLTDMRLGQSTQAGLPPGAYQGQWPVKLALQTQDELYETFSYVSGGTYAADSPAFHSTITRDSSGFFTATLKNQRSYKFDPNEYLIRAADKNGYSVWYGYTNLKVTSIQDDNGHTLNLAYNAQGLLSTLSDWANRTVTYGYDSAGHLTSVMDPRSGVTHYAYDSNNNMTSITNRTNSVTITNTFNSEHKIATQVKANGPTSTFTYDEANRVITDTDNNGRVNKTYYDDKARTLEQDDPYNNKVYYTYGAEYSPLTVKDKLGNTNTYTYDSNGNTTSTTNPAGKQITYAYDTKNNVTSITDGRYLPSKITSFTYDGSGNMTQKNDAGRTTNYAYTYPGSLISQTDPLSHTTQWTRDVFGSKLTETTANGNVTNYTYDSLGRLTQQTDPSSNTKSFTYDNNGNVLTITDAAGTTTNTYNGENVITQTTSPTNTVTQYAYNVADSQISTTDALTHATGYGYDQYQNMTSRQDALTHTTQYAYDQLNRKTSSTTPLGKVSQWAYDANGNITSRTDASSRVTNYQYDNLNRLTKTTYPDTSIVTYTYDDHGNMLSMVSPVGTTTYGYDNYDHMMSATDPHSQTVNYQYDATDNLSQITYPGGNIVRYTYDSVNRLRTVADWNGQVTNYQYNNNGTLASKTLPNGILSSYTYDNVNRLTGVTNSKNQQAITQYGYTRDANGSITSSTEAGPQAATTYNIMDEGLATGWGNWSWGSTLNFTDTASPYSGTKDTAWTITGAWGAMDLHNSNGVSTTPYSAITVAIKATGASAKFGITLRGANDAALGSTVNVAAYGGYPTTSGYKVYTVPLSALGGSATTIYGVSLDDVSGGAQPKMYVDTLKLTTAPATPITVYDEGLAPNFLDWSWGSVNNFNDTTYPYVGTKDLNWTNTTGWGGLDIGYPSNFSTSGYQTLSVAIRGTQQNQVIYTQFYDNNGTPLGTAKNIAAYGGNPDPYGYKVYNIPLADLAASNKSISEMIFEDQTGQPQTAYIDKLKLLPAMAATAPAQTSSFTYDSLGRVLSATYPSSSYSYTYDANGNRLTSNEAGTNSTYTVNNDNQITAKSSRALTYDNQGNEVTDSTKTLGYDFDNRLTSLINGPQTTSFKYDGAGNRIEKNINGVATYQFVNDLSGNLSRVLVTKNVPAGTSTFYVYDGSSLVSQGGTTSTSRQYYLDDGLGNIRAVVDSTGNNVQSYNFDPYGNQVTGSNTSDFKYENQQTDSETGLYYLRARTYDPTLGSFTSRDPIFGSKNNPQSQDEYNYTNDNPINGTDPSGKQFLLTGVGGIFNPVNVYNYFFPAPSACPSGYSSIPGLGSIKDSAQFKKLTDQQIQQFKNAGYDIHAIKQQNGALDLYYDSKTGEVYMKPVGGVGDPDPVGINLRLLDL